MAEVHVAERCGEGDVAVVGVVFPGGWVGFEEGHGAVDFGLQAIDPGFDAHVLGAVAAFVDLQKRLFHQAVGEGGERECAPAFGA